MGCCVSQRKYKHKNPEVPELPRVPTDTNIVVQERDHVQAADWFDHSGGQSTLKKMAWVSSEEVFTPSKQPSADSHKHAHAHHDVHVVDEDKVKEKERIYKEEQERLEREAERRKKDELHRQEEEQRHKAEQKRLEDEAEARRREEERVQREAEELRKHQELERRIREEAEIEMKKQALIQHEKELERIRQLEAQVQALLEAQAQKQREEEERKRQEEERQRQAEEERQRKEEEERRLKEEEEERKRKAEEEAEAARQRQEEEAEAARQRQEEEARRRIEEEEERQRKEEEERHNREAHERRERELAQKHRLEQEEKRRLADLRIKEQEAERERERQAKAVYESEDPMAAIEERKRKAAVLQNMLTQHNPDINEKPHGGIKRSASNFETKHQPFAPPPMIKQGSVKSLPADEDEWEELDERAVKAAEWADKEIRKLIDEIKKHGAKGPDGKYTVKFGPLFYATDQVFEALAGTLKSAKRYNVVDYPGDVLMQRAHDNVSVILLKETHDGIEVKRRKKLSAIGGKAPTTSGFGGASKQHAQSKCVVCSKTVYPMEYVGVGDKAFHKACFRCDTCKSVLKATDHCNVDSKYFCTPHYLAYCMANKL